MLTATHDLFPLPCRRRQLPIRAASPLPPDLLFDAMPMALLLTDASGQCLDANRSALRLLGQPHDGVVGRDIREFLPEAVDLSARRAPGGSDGAVELGEATLRRTGASALRVALSLTIMQAPDQPMLAYFFRDISDEAALIARLRKAASTDPLTGLLNRIALEEALDRTLRRISRGAPAAALCLIDLDNFKAVNDSYGHAVGDRVLRAVADELRVRLRATDAAGRIGGDEFALVLNGCSGTDALMFINALQERIARLDISLPGGRCGPGLSAGIRVLNEHTTSVAAALEEADRACYAAKAAGRSQAQMFAGA